jgi:hypothetical protein
MVLLNSSGACLVLGNKIQGNKSYRQAAAFMRFFGGTSDAHSMLAFKIDHYSGFDILLCDTGQNILLVDLNAVVQQPFVHTPIPVCTLAVTYNSSEKSIAHEHRKTLAIYLSHLIAACHAKEVLPGPQDYKWLSRSTYFCRDLPSMQIIPPRDKTSVIALTQNGSFVPWGSISKPYEDSRN